MVECKLCRRVTNKEQSTRMFSVFTLEDCLWSKDEMDESNAPRPFATSLY
jgi:hypothetical protein